MKAQNHVLLRKTAFYMLILTCIIPVLYGVSYDRFRHFDVADPKGASDAPDYVKMSYGNYSVSWSHKYRIVVPLLARGLRSLVAKYISDKNVLDKLPFYGVNFIFMSLCALLLFEFLCHLKFERWLSAFGTVIFLTSRITVLATGTPLVESFYLLSVILIVLLAARNKIKYLAAIMPILILSKEGIYPVAMIPLLTKKGRSPLYICSLALSFVLVYFVRRYVNTLPNPAHFVPLSFFSSLLIGMNVILDNIKRLFTFEGIRDLQGSFSFFLLYAILGYFVNRKYHLYNIPGFVLLLVPLSVFFAFINNALGRMLFYGFPALIPFMLVFIKYAHTETQGYLANHSRQVDKT